MRKLLLAAALVVSAGATPAVAADVKTLSCIIVEMPAEARTALMNGGGKLAAQEATSLPPEASAAAATAGKACQKKHGWSDAALNAALTYSIAQAAYAGAVARADQLGIKEGPFLAALSTLSDAQLQGVLKQDGESINAFARALISKGLDVDEKKGAVLGVMAGLWIMSDNNRTAFAAA
jgi:opacity protein-like surface antigen